MFATALCLWMSILANTSPGQSPERVASLPGSLQPLNRQASQKSIRLRVSWGGGVAQAWQGTVIVKRGRFSRNRSLALTADSPGAIRDVNGTIVIRQPSPTNYGGFDVTVDGDAETTLEFELYSADQPELVFRQTVEFLQLLGGKTEVEIDDQQNQLTIARAPGDRLRIDVAQSTMIFHPGEMMSLGITPNLTGISARSANCRLKIVPARNSGPALWTQTLDFTLDENGSGRRERLELALPGTEGVYDLILELEPNWYQIPFNGRKQSVQRTIQLVVLDNEEPSAAGDMSWKEFLTIDPVTGRPLTRSTSASLAQLNRLISASSSHPLGNKKFQPTSPESRSETGILAELEVGGWQAIPLPIGKQGLPHIVEIEFAATSAMAIGTSIIQPDATGQIPSVGFDSGVAIPSVIVQPDLRQNETGLLMHRIIFWPNSETPYLLIANRHEKRPARIGKIRILNGPRRLPQLEATHATDGKRTLMAFYEMPLFPENFGVGEVIDPAIQQPLDDWLTFYQGADRFIQHLKANSYGGAYVTVAVDGSSIYPSELLDPSPKFDSGVFFFNGQDPKRKDVLEMLFRMFDRAGLKLVPTLTFNSPLPEIESLRHSDGSVNEFDLINFRQQPRSAKQTGLPIYNPLNIAVQGAVTRIVEELAERYRSHNAFRGVAISCRPDTFTQLLGLQWCYDPMTVRRYKTTVKSNSTDEMFVSELTGPRKQEWLDWRAGQMTAWYLQMLDAVRRHVPNGKLILAPSDIYENEEVSSALSPSLHLSVDFAGTMLQLGFSPKLPREDSSLVILKPQRIAPNQPLASQRVEIQVASSNQARDFYRQGDNRGSLFTMRMSWAHFSELQKQIAFGNQASPLVRLQQLSLAGPANRQRFAESLRDNDSNVLVNGGILISSGQELSLLEFMKVFSQLPDIRFTDVTTSSLVGSKGPIAVRQCTVEGDWYFYAVNSSPWPVNCTVRLDRPNAGEIDSLSAAPLQKLRGEQTVEFQIEPFGLVGGRSDDESTQISNFSVRFPEDADQPLRSHLQTLQSKLVRASKASPIEILDNPDFETNGQPSLEGWDLGRQSVQNVKIDNHEGYTGSSSLVLTSTGNTVWIRSSSFAAPETGRLSVSVWLRTEDPKQQPPLRLALEGRTDNTDYYRFGSIGALAAASSTKRVEGHWQRFAVHFDDLPTQGIRDLRIGFDLMGPGQVWIDNVEIYDRWFDSNDSKAITQLLATARILLSNPENIDQCRKILRGYWPRFLDENFPDSVAPAIDGPTVAPESPTERTVRSPRTRPKKPRKRKTYR